VLQPLHAQDGEGRDLRAQLLAQDGAYYEMPQTGDWGWVTFQAPERVDSAKRTVFLHSRGYYRLHLDALGAPDHAMLRQIAEIPGRAARLAATLFAEFQQQRAMKR
jgi:hypothetical protein